MLRRQWSLWAACAGIIYLGAAALRVAPRAVTVWLGLALGLLVVLLGWRLLAPPVRGPDRVDPLARRAGKVVMAGTGLTIVAALAPAAASFTAARGVGTGLGCTASLIVLVRVTSLGGLASQPAGRAWRQLDAVVLVALMWIAAVALSAVRTLAPATMTVPEAVTVDYAHVAASLGSLGITVVAAVRLFLQRRYELGVAERAAAALWLSILCLTVGVFATLMVVAEPEQVVPATALGAAVCVTAAGVSASPSLLSRALRTAVSVTMLCAPVVCVAVVAAFKAPTHAGLILFVVTIVAAGLGLLAPRLAARLAPERGRWLQVLDAALLASKQPDPEQTLVAVLRAVREGLPADSVRPWIYRIAAADRVTVDRAGYIHSEHAEVPPRLLELAEQEPERVLSLEALRYVQVRRPDVRPLVSWLEVREAAATALIMDEEVCVGVLLWPAAGRETPLAHEEVVALRRLADHLGAAIGAAAQLARSRARELVAEHEVAAAQRELLQLQAVRAREAQSRRAEAQLIARPATVACYSPAAQTALLRAERLGQSGESLALLAPPGTAAECWAAVAHLASPRSGSKLLVVDAAEEANQPLCYWQDPATSPLEIAWGGTVAILDAQLLPEETQRYISAVAAAEVLPPGGPAGGGADPAAPPVTLVLAVPPAPGDEPLGRLSPWLSDRVEDRILALPKLAERAEDLRALALHKLSRFGLRLRGKPFGLSLRAQELLGDYSWPGNEAELEVVLRHGALALTGDVLDSEHLRPYIESPPPSDAQPRRAAGS